MVNVQDLSCCAGLGKRHRHSIYYIMEEKDRNLVRMLGVLSTVGLTLVFATAIGLYIGLKLDKWLGTSPWFTAVFVLLGLIAGFRNLFVYAKRSQKMLEEDDDKKHD
jgi:ATP synthase protein I